MVVLGKPKVMKRENVPERSKPKMHLGKSKKQKFYGRDRSSRRKNVVKIGEWGRMKSAVTGTKTNVATFD